MKESLDKLFREKLQKLDSTPSVNAWNQIESELESGKTGISWYYMAAAVAVVFTVSAVWVSQNQKIESDPEINLTSNTIKAAPTELSRTFSDEDVTKKTNDQQQFVALNSSLIIDKTIKNSMKEPPQSSELEPILLNSDPLLSLQVVKPKVEYSLASMQLEFYPMYVDGVVADDSKIKRALQYAKRVKNGEENLFNLKKAKEDLFAFAKNKFKSEENTQVNFD